MRLEVLERGVSALRPYRAGFCSRFATLIQYRGAALAGVVTQCWWGGIKIMILAGFFPAAERAARAAATAGDLPAPLGLSNAITYIWVSQALFSMLPWTADPDVVRDVRTGAIAHDRLRPVDTFGYWFARSAGWLAARALPRALPLCVLTMLGLPLLGLGEWAWRPPPSAAAAAGFAVSLILALLLSSAVLMLVNVLVVALLDERGINALLLPVVLVGSGNLLPLSLFPESLRLVLLLQPLAGVLDIPIRIYCADLAGGAVGLGLALQLFWTLLSVAAGRCVLRRALARLEVQGG